MISASINNMEQPRCISLHERICKIGSLPLKKRRVSLESLQIIKPEMRMDTARMTALSLMAVATSDKATNSNNTLPKISAEGSYEEDDDELIRSLPEISGGGMKTIETGSSSNKQRSIVDMASNHCNHSKILIQHHRIGSKTKISMMNQHRASSSSPSSNASSTNKSSSSSQDKRYTGAPNEVRCGAVTTRGRACSYIAVQNTSYCFLHADYESNPPSRRTKSIDETAVSSSKKDTSNSTTTTKQTNKKKRRPLAEKHADAPYPLLSMISTDQWRDKTVKLAVGPLKDRIGTVEKWGNGWVSVKVPGVGLHNRRSFELYLQDKQTDEASIFRCVSRDVVSPSPSSSTDCGGNNKPSSFRSHTPALKTVESAEAGIAKFHPETPVPSGRSTVLTAGATPLPANNNACASPNKVTPFTPARSMATFTQDNFQLQLPGADDNMIFRPSVGERTRGRMAEKLMVLPKKRSRPYDG